MATTYKVVKDDTLWDIVQKPEYSKLIAGNTVNAKIQTVVKLNKIKDPDFIVVGQTLTLAGSTATTTTANNNVPVINVFGLRAKQDNGKSREMYAGWTWSGGSTKGFQVKWTYRTAEGLWFTGNDGSVGTDKASAWTAPEEAVEVRLRVRAEYDTEKASYSDWSATKSHVFVDAPPKPPAPTVQLEDHRLTAWINDADGDLGGTIAVFEVWRNDTAKIATSGDVAIRTGYATWSMPDNFVASGYSYKVRCKIVKVVSSTRVDSEWSDYSTSVSSAPTKPKITELSAKDKDRVYIAWSASSVSNSSIKILYEVQYIAEDPTLFDTSDNAKTVSGIESTSWNISDITTGIEYFFRVRAVSNATGEMSGGDASYWSAIKSIKVGEVPAAPTTWSSANTAILGEPIRLYWIHNSKDGSSETYARIRHKRPGDVHTVILDTIKNEATGDEKDLTKSYEYPTDEFTEGAEIKWSVCTGGVTCDGVTQSTFGPYSETRSFKVYVRPNLNLMVRGSGIVFDGTYDFPLLKCLPITVTAKNLVDDTVQQPIGYSIQIISNMYHETVNYRGENIVVGEGEVVYKEYFDISTPLNVTLNNLDLADGVDYTVRCTMAMDSGIIAEAEYRFYTDFSERTVDIGATIDLDKDGYRAIIYPSARNENNDIIPEITFGVYRREYDGSMTEIATGIRNDKTTAITDPHPSLDVTRYRIVATDPTTSAVYCADINGPAFEDKPVIVQWDENWKTYELSDEQPSQEPAWAGSILKLPYNIDITDTRQPEVSLIKYIGREHPVAYYGTQMDEGSSLNVTIDAEDKDTIFMLRRLSRWKGNVYIREPSGVGYWANVRVSFGQKHREVAIPVTLEITRVEGGA